MSKITNLTEAILNADKNYPDSKGKIYSPWGERYSETISDFYTDFIEDRLPNPDVVIEWHNMLVNYSKRKEAIFPVRAGNNKKSLRRGWLVRVDDGFSYMFTDNDLASYIYKMALDGFCPEVDEFIKFMTEFVKVDDITWLKTLNKNPKKKKEFAINNVIDSATGKERHFLRLPVHFHQIGGSGIDATEDERNAYVNTHPAPVCCLGEYNYKHAHLVGVADVAYEIPGEGKLEFKSIKQDLLGDVDNYQWKDDICNYAWDRKISEYNGEIPFAAIEEMIKAQFFRFLDPLNHFLAPKEQQNKFTKWGRYPSLDIAEYKNLLKYLLEKKKINHPTIFDEFRDKIAAPNDEFDYDIDCLSAEPIHVVYHEKSLSEATYGNKVKPPKVKSTLSPRVFSSNDPAIILVPSDEEIFKRELLTKKRAEITWIYNDGTQENKVWNVSKLSASSDVIGNLRSRQQWRNREANGLLEVRAKIK